MKIHPGRGVVRELEPNSSDATKTGGPCPRIGVRSQLLCY